MELFRGQIFLTFWCLKHKYGALFSSFIAIILTKENAPCLENGNLSEKGIRNGWLASQIIGIFLFFLFFFSRIRKNIQDSVRKRGPAFQKVGKKNFHDTTFGFPQKSAIFDSRSLTFATTTSCVTWRPVGRPPSATGSSSTRSGSSWGAGWGMTITKAPNLVEIWPLG